MNQQNFVDALTRKSVEVYIIKFSSLANAILSIQVLDVYNCMSSSLS